MQLTNHLRVFGIGLSVLTAAASAQDAVAPAIRTAPAILLEDAGLFDATIQTLEDLPQDPGPTFTFPLWVDGTTREVTAWPYSMRAPGYRLMVQDATGGYVEHPSTPVTSYRGEVSGFPGSVAALTLFEGQVRGTVMLLPELPMLSIRPVSDLYPGADRDEYVVHSHDNVIPTDATCGGAIEVLRADSSTPGAPAPDGGPADDKIAEIAIDSDFEFFQSNGSSVPATENDITTVMNSVEAIYDKDTQITYDITVIYVETSEPDPFSSSSSSTLLNQFQNHWNSQHAADPRDVAHLFTGKNLTGFTIGVAYLNVICNKSSAYGLSQSKFSFSLSSRAALTAHELGHNWNASHCDSTTCYIMCSGIGSCGPITLFAPTSKTKITNKKAAVGCLTTPPPPSAPFLTTISPGTAAAFPGDTLTVGGFFLSDVTSVSVGGIVTTNFDIISDFLMTFGAPTATSLGSKQVTMTNETGVSNPLNLTIVETDPPRLNATGLTATGLGVIWNFGAQQDDLWFLLVSINDNTTFPFAGSDILLNALMLSSGTLSIAGIGSEAIIVPPGASGAAVYSQAVFLDSGTLSFEGVTNITASSIII